MDNNLKIFLAGHNGMVGSAILRELQKQSYKNIILAEKKDLDLRQQQQVDKFFWKNQPEYVILSAAKVGGINANMKFPFEFLYDNLMIQNNIAYSCLKYKVKKLIFLGSSCIYPKNCKQPMKEEYLLTGKLEDTNESYALAKIAGLKLNQALNKQYGFQSLNLMPCNLYGPNDSFDLEHSHVLSALVKRFIDAKVNNISEITLWGTGIAKREFLYVEDLARAVLFLEEKYTSCEPINVGTGEDISIKNLANLIAKKVNFNGEIKWDDSKPDGMLRKCLDITKIQKLGFKPLVSFSEGIDYMIEQYKFQQVKHQSS